MKRAILFSVIFSLLFCFNIPVFAQDYSSEKPSATDVAWDVLWIRPLGFLGLALGEVAYVISLPVTIPLVVLRAVPVVGVETTPAGARVAALLRELLKEGLSLTTAYTALVDSFRDAQAELRRVTAAFAEGSPLAEPVIAQAQTALQLAISTDGKECNAHDFTSFTLSGAALYDLWVEVSEGLSLRRCAWKECGRIFIPKDRRHRCHSAFCMRRLKKEEKRPK